MRAVFDCMVFLQGLARPNGPAAECLRQAEADRFELWLSAEILDEVHDLLTRPKIREKFRSLTQELVDEFFARLPTFVKFLDAPAKTASLPRDPKDEKYLDAAIAVNASYLVSRDLDLLSLMDVAKAEGRTFRRSHPALEIVDPPGFLKRLSAIEGG